MELCVPALFFYSGILIGNADGSRKKGGEQSAEG